jgi:hypothetical protein
LPALPETERVPAPIPVLAPVPACRAGAFERRPVPPSTSRCTAPPATPSRPERKFIRLASVHSPDAAEREVLQSEYLNSHGLADFYEANDPATVRRIGWQLVSLPSVASAAADRKSPSLRQPCLFGDSAGRRTARGPHAASPTMGICVRRGKSKLPPL